MNAPFILREAITLPSTQAPMVFQIYERIQLVVKGEVNTTCTMVHSRNSEEILKHSYGGEDDIFNTSFLKQVAQKYHHGAVHMNAPGGYPSFTIHLRDTPFPLSGIFLPNFEPVQSAHVFPILTARFN